MTTATMRLIEAVERLNMSGSIGDGMVAQLHDLAGMARLEQNPADVLAHLASKAGRVVDPARHKAMRAHCAEQVTREAACGGHGVALPCADCDANRFV